MQTTAASIGAEEQQSHLTSIITKELWRVCYVSLRRGQSPAEADLNLLETARRCELYGMKMHPAKDHDGMPLNLAVAHMGIAVFQNITRINTFSWAKIRKISFKRKRFLIKLHPEGYGFYKDTVEFLFEERNACKNFWKKCVENHGFFRCAVVQNQPRRKTKVLSRGSSFRRNFHVVSVCVRTRVFVIVKNASKM
ncbi:hypothetical protein GQX74_004728 [Glossina fuscipes]|nr:hypothetical protein GQX74_004728 [Glossina fuscipes]